jgi:RNA polymerase sigma factor (sigma-70 family)
MQHPLVTTPAARPSRAQIEPAALALLSRHSAGLLATARRYSVTPEDAEDAYQRGVEILLTKAPSTTEDELLPWLRTVIKHESFAVRKSSGRAVPDDDPLAGEPDERAWTDDRAERYERLRLGAEAMAGLKPQEIRCLLLKAEGLSYQEICEVTGWTYTKVNRCLSEGRRAFLERVANIESGAECERVAPLISKVADGEASAAEMRRVRPHLKGCLACKATLREYRATPTRLAGLVPPVAVLAGGGGGGAGVVGRIAQALHERLGAVGELAGAKAAVVAASAVVLAGGGAAGVEALHDPPRVAPDVFVHAQAPARDPSTQSSRGAVTGPTQVAPDPVVPATGAFALQPASAAPASAAAPPASQAPEFDPGTASAAPAPATASEYTPASEPVPSSTRDSGGGEFGP